MRSVAMMRLAQMPMAQRLIASCQQMLNHFRYHLANSLRVRFALTLTLLISCVVILSVLVGVVPDRKAERIQSRIQVAEAVATLGSILLREGDPTGFRNSLQFVVERNPEIHAVVLKRDAGDDVRFSTALADTEEKYSSGTVQTDVIHVPLLRQKKQWGELLVHFVSDSNMPWHKRLMQARWSAVLFIPLASFVLFLLLPGKLLQALMRARTISTRQSLSEHSLPTGAAAKCRPGSLRAWLRARQRARDAKHEKVSTGMPHDAVRPARILVVDDSEENRQFLSIVFKDMGHEVVLAAHGRQALQAMFAEEQVSNRFDLVFMNVDMPVMDGYTTVKEMRLRGVRGAVVALASSTLPGAKEKALAAGYSHFLAKPIDLDKMVALVNSRPSGRQSVVPEIPGSTRKGIVPVFSKLPVTQPFFYRISGSFIEGLPERLSELRRAVIKNENDKVTQITADIKGLAVKAGYPGFSELCKRLQTSGSGAERDAARSLNELERYAKRVITGWQQTAAPRTAVQNNQFTATIKAFSTA